VRTPDAPDAITPPATPEAIRARLREMVDVMPEDLVAALVAFLAWFRDVC
jgi:hypothetical protein